VDVGRELFDARRQLMNLLKLRHSIRIQRWGMAKTCAFFAILLVPVLAAESVSSASNNAGAEVPITENEVKAAYVFYFAKFVVWPQDTFETTYAPITIGVLGDDEFGSILEKISKGKTIQEHPIAVRLLKWPVDPRSCHIVYIGPAEQKRFIQIVESLQNSSVLTVTETEADLRVKGIINLFVEGGKVQFEANIARAEKAHLQISSKLLRMARGFSGKGLGKGE
jgi:hypothetical protein